MAFLFPCPWTYLEIGQRLIKEINPDSTHLFYEWITFYGADRVNHFTQWYCRKLDELYIND
nr:hypothetical protein [Bacillus sp. CGMCC 1.16541]